MLLDALAPFTPENLGRLGVEGHDTEILDLKPNATARFLAATASASRRLEALRAQETDVAATQDLDILIKAAHDFAKGAELEEALLVPYEHLERAIYVGTSSLLVESIPPERRTNALIRIRRYAGLEPGFTPIVDLAIAEIRPKLDKPGLAFPVREDVEKDLNDGAAFKKGIRELVSKYLDASALEALTTLEGQLDRWEAFVRSEVVPKARTDFRLPLELYRFALERNGIDLDPEALAAKARDAFAKTQAEMNELTQGTDYRNRIRELKKQQVSGDDLLHLYQKRITDLEAVIKAHDLVTLPDRPMIFRFATAAETAEQPAPHVDPQGLFSRDKNVRLAFVLPLAVGAGNNALRYDDFTFDAAAWTLTAHEGRPGHDLQLSIIAERGLTLARTLFAFNSTNVEGWGLYAESISRPYMPPDGRLISLQHLLMREARAFLDPELQLGKITVEAARHVLEDDVGLSPAMATQELQRYTFKMPGQAPCYFYGYTRIQRLRAEIEQALGSRFDAKRFHDTILAQGLLPPDLMDKAVRARLGGEG
jgi:hypothetical protein